MEICYGYFCNLKVTKLLICIIVQDEVQLEVSMPWLKAVMEVTKSLNLACTHQGEEIV